MLTFYSVDFVYKKTFVSVRRLKRISKSDFKMYTKKMSIEDPFYTNQSLSRHLSTQTNKYIITAINKTCLYFGQLTHQLSNVPSPSNTYSTIKEKIVEKLIEETGINEARKFVCKNINMEDNGDDEESDESEEDENAPDDDLANENDEVDFNDETISDDFAFDLDENDDTTGEVGEDEEWK